jgi:hypothetical protein
MEMVGVVGKVGNCVGSGDGEGETNVGKNGVAEGRDAAPERVGVESVPEASSWLNKKLPSSIPTLMTVIANPPSSWPRPAGRSVPEFGLPLTSPLILLELGTSQRRGTLAGRGPLQGIGAG